MFNFFFCEPVSVVGIQQKNILCILFIEVINPGQVAGLLTAGIQVRPMPLILCLPDQPWESCLGCSTYVCMYTWYLF